MQKNKFQLGLVVPCFNEAERFPLSYWKNLVRIESSIKWIFVDDGSSDLTENILKQLCKSSDAKYVKLQLNLGKSNAIREGFHQLVKENPKLKFAGFLDSDGAFSPEDIRYLATLANNDGNLNPQNSFDVWISSRVALAGRRIQRKLSRHYIGRVISTYLTRSWNDSPYDTQSGFKIFRVSGNFLEALEKPFITRWFIDVELLTRIAIANNGKLKVWEEPVTSWRDVHGSRISLSSGLSILSDLFRTRRQVKKLIELRGRDGLN